MVEGDPSGIEPLLPLVVHGSLGAEDPSSLTPLHYQQLVRVGQACLDVLWEAGKAASEQLVRGGGDGQGWQGEAVMRGHGRRVVLAFRYGRACEHLHCRGLGVGCSDGSRK